MHGNSEPSRFKPLGEKPENSAALPGYLYSDPAVFAREQAEIFHRSWQLVAHVSELRSAGDFVCADISGEPVFVIRGKDGELAGFYNVCQHRAHQLLAGAGNVKNRIVCPYHAWTYNTDGSLAAARNTQRMPQFDPHDYRLEPVRVETALGFVFVNLSQDAESLEAIAGDMFADMKRELPWISDELELAAGSDTSSGWGGAKLNANWKVLAENCLECYHCGPAHPALVDLVDMQQYVCEPSGGHWLKSYGPVKNLSNKAYDVDAGSDVQQAIFWHLFPNVEFGVLPGEKLIGAFRFFPVSAEETRMTSRLLSPGGAPMSDAAADYRWNVLWPEDEALCTSVHKGLKSAGYRQGRFVVDKNNPGISEHGVHYFQTLYASAMGLK